ncbi:hypothetical protein Btru_053309 [Bulinus truncatus]|nr:hypothetical protein Btru_053309 [Bulinus truncatus]
MKFIILIAAFVCLTFAEDKPGIEVRLKQRAFQYGEKIAPKVLKDVIEGKKLGDFQDKDDTVTYRLKNTIVGETNLRDLDISLDPSNNGIRVQITKLNTSLKMDYDASVDLGFMMSSSGSLKIDLRQVDLDLKITLEADQEKRPKPKTQECKAKIGEHEFEFSSIVFHWVYRLMSRIIPTSARSWAEEKLCRQVTDFIDNQAYETIKSVKLSTLMDKFQADYSHVSPVRVSEKSISARHQGKISWKGDNKPTNAQPQDLPSEDKDDDEKMFNIWFEEYVAKSFAESAHNNEYLKGRIADDTVSSDSQRDMLSLSCQRSTCAGGILPELSVNDGNAWLQLDVSSNRTPDVEITEEGVQFHLHGDVSVSTRINKNIKQQFIAKVTVKLFAKAHVEDGRVVPDIISTDVEIKQLTKVQIQPQESSVLNLLHMIVRDIAAPQFQELARSGLPLMSLDDLRLENPEIRFFKGSMSLATDVKYKDN